MNIKQRVYTLALAAILALGSLTAPAQAAELGFFPSRTYAEQFTDVSRSDWYYDAVKALYELGLTNGRGAADTFDPGGEVTVAEVVTMASRLRSLYDTGGSETGSAAYGGGAWYLPYVSHLQAQGVIGREFEGSYERPATRAEMAHILAGTLPEALLEPVNREVVATGHAAGQYIKDVDDSTAYQADILLLYSWGVTEGTDETGAFLPEKRISRCEAAAMVARLAYSELRLTLDWEVQPAYSRKGTTLADLVESDGTFYPSPSPRDVEQIQADVRYMLSRGERSITLEYPEGTTTRAFVDGMLEAFLTAVRDYVEQTYNNVTAPYSPRSRTLTITFSSSLYDDAETEWYRNAILDAALEVHDQMWETGRIREDMSEYEKARAYFAWICENCRYDNSDRLMSHSAYRLFSEGVAVCDGYTAAYNLLLKLEGISCGTWSAAQHIWTVAELDGQTCHIDTTWGDQSYGVEYRFFAMTEQDAVSRF